MGKEITAKEASEILNAGGQVIGVSALNITRVFKDFDNKLFHFVNETQTWTPNKARVTYFMGSVWYELPKSEYK